MARLLLENALDSLSLNGVAETGTGVQATTGLTGFGLPPVSVQWLEGAGDGAVYRRTRVQPRDIDIPLDIVGRDTAHLKQLLSRLAKLFSGRATLRFFDGDSVEWRTDVVRVGGFDVNYGGSTTGNKDLQTVVTLRAGDPYWTAAKASIKTVGGGTPPAAFVSSFLTLPVAPSQAIGQMTLDNTGDATAYPVWTVFGPGDTFTAVSPSGETLVWEGELEDGEKLTIDSRYGTVIDGTGANRYAELAPAPRFWSLPPGQTTCTASLLNITASSKIVCSWQARKWMVI
ncbi:minor tail protein [Streptomyces phage Celia]|uniref:Minor tail protein n=1 Tax=Streptomyces phage Celia TaxID=2590946 RepID=A0A516KR95_9CAUD|nr:minor tail protein [Streptomyces phage Celia]QDP44222.1 minor tail protein [Streptomyces phage Celia]QFG10482.1 minor tail protein [Streptomyces phage Urza]QJD50584.1 minor tail protein [Streptomyces phage Itza]